ncbi:glycine rich domain-containing protein [Clostridioides difficile]
MQTVWNFDYTGKGQVVTLPPGKYKLECWGAAGGCASGVPKDSGSRGGYASGELTLKKETTLYVYVGQDGGDPSNTGINGGFNGGGGGAVVKGGGATDIRLSGYTTTQWDASWSIASRIIVAGGGGGIVRGRVNGNAHGGGEKGDNGFANTAYVYAPGGTQFNGGRGYSESQDGKFGYSTSVIPKNDVGGGGGWYGGASCASSTANIECNGGGGSGYVLTKDSYKPIGVNFSSYLPKSEYYMTNPVLTTGGNTTSKNGYAKITLLQALPFLNISSYNSTTATFKADHTDLTLLTKIEYFIDDVLKETITTDLTLEKTINYTLEDNALHTLKIVVTDSNNATVEKVLTISKGITPLPAGSSSEEVTNKWMEIKDAFKTGKTSIINTLALKNVSVSLDNTLVEFSEKIKTFFDSSDASLSQLQNQLTSANNTITQLNARYKIASGRTDPVYTGGVEKVLVYNATYEKQFHNWITINNLGFKPNVFYAECDYVNSFTKSKNKLFIFACCGLSTSSNKDFVFTCDIGLRSSDSEYKTTDCGLYYNNERDVHITDNLIHIPAFNTVNATVKASYYWRAIKIY